MKRVLALSLCLFPVVAALSAPDVHPAQTQHSLHPRRRHGRTDAGFIGGKDIRTPHLDKLAGGGAILRSYVQPVCSPTRAALMTGRYAIAHRRLHRRAAPRPVGPEA